MNEKEIQEGNRLIAEFMGFEKVNDNKYDIVYKQENNAYVWECQLQYHSSWEWLIPACKKFQNLVMNKQIKPSEEFTQYYESIENAWSLFEIEHLFRTSVEAIQWYNTQNK